MHLRVLDGLLEQRARRRARCARQGRAQLHVAHGWEHALPQGGHLCQLPVERLEDCELRGTVHGAAPHRWQASAVEATEALGAPDGRARLGSAHASAEATLRLQLRLHRVEGMADNRVGCTEDSTRRGRHGVLCRKRSARLRGHAHALPGSILPP